MRQTIKRILSLNIARKILFGYLILSAFTIVLGIYALTALNKINLTNRSIIETDTQIVSITDMAIESLLSQELYGRKYVILKTPEMLALFWERNVEFEQKIRELNTLPDIETTAVNNTIALHKDYTEAFHTSFNVLMRNYNGEAKKADDKIKHKQKLIIDLINSISTKAHANLEKKMIIVSGLGLSAFRIAVILSALALLTGISAAAIITRGISESINIIMSATNKIATGNFDDLPVVEKDDELGELSKALHHMAARIKHLEEMYLDASPLTHLPGGIAIENVLKKRLTTFHPLAFCLLDMDNFKGFNDYYGYAKGSELIVAVSNIIESTVRELGVEDDFVGHIGGDDFALITTPSSISHLCSAIIDRFDREIRAFYSPEDRERGYIIGTTRQGEETKFPIVTISIAVVTNQNRKLSSHLEVGEIAAELKEYAKSMKGSLFVVDHRRKIERPV